eukprot:CFRG0936T1
MGVCKVFIIDPNDKTLAQLHSVEKIYKRLELLCGQPKGTWRVDCDLYQYGPKTMPFVRFSGASEHRFCLYNQSMMEGGEELEAFMEKLKNSWVKRKSVKMEGISYELGDFIVDVGSVVVGSQDRGIIVRIVYTPSTSQSKCTGILLEMYTTIFRPTQANPSTPDVFPSCDFPSVGLDPEDCANRHVAFQYIDALRKGNIL